MKLNCRPGDLAVHINATQVKNIGKIVEIVRYAGALRGKALWVVNGLPGFSFDEDLRPIRDQPGEDETLTWAPVPHKETV